MGKGRGKTYDLRDPVSVNTRNNDVSIPLFGEDAPKTRAFDLGFGIITIICVLITIGLSFGNNRGEIKLKAFFGVVIGLVTLPQLVLVKWFRDGDLHPKFRVLISYMMLTIVLLCVAGNIYFLDDKAKDWICNNSAPVKPPPGDEGMTWLL